MPSGAEPEILLSYNDRDMDLFNLISAPNPTNVKTKTRLRAAHELALLTVTVKDQVQDKVAYEIPPTGNASTTGVTLEEEVAAMGPPVNKRRRKRGNNETEANAPPKVLKRDHDAFCPAQSTHGRKSLASIGLDAGSLLSTPAAHDPSTTTKSMSNPELISSKGTATEIPTKDVATTKVNAQFSVRSLESGRSTYVPFVVGSSGARGQATKESQVLDSQTGSEDPIHMKKAAEAKNAEPAKELDSLRV
ncbi:hypothetical protein Tco_1495492 [Tanacetum coccineum]